jgi:hypothetical protein
MIGLRRLGEPAILTEKKADWQVTYDAKRAANPKARPESKQYAHHQIKETLEAMSHGKCFYCEGEGGEVDHYIEVVERGDLVFAWANLYIACKGCQAKIPNKSSQVIDCVDPCDPAMNPADHLKFKAEYIFFRTQRGEQTIKKYRLKRGPLESDRRRMLQLFNAELNEITETAGRRDMSLTDRRRLLQYGQPDSPFSLMFGAYLDGLKIAEE